MTSNTEQKSKCYGQAAPLDAMVQYADDSIVSKTLLDSPAGTLTLFAFDAGQNLSEHTAPYDAVIQVVDGQSVVTIAGTDHDVRTGEMIIMPANISHAVRAEQKFKMLLTMIRFKKQ